MFLAGMIVVVIINNSRVEIIWGIAPVRPGPFMVIFLPPGAGPKQAVSLFYRGRGGGMAMPAESPPRPTKNIVCMFVCMYVCMFVRNYLEYGYKCAIR